MRRALLVVAFALLLGAGSAHAATYTVSSCMNVDGSGTNHSWNAFGPTTGWQCDSGIGLWADARAWQPWLGQSGWSATAPPGTTITGYDAWWHVDWLDGTWGAQVDDGRNYTDGPCYGGYPCGWLPAASWVQSWGWAHFARYGINTSTLRSVAYCVSSSCPTGWVHVWMNKAQIQVTDSTPPAVTLNGASGWVRGTQTVAWSASDGSGVRRSRVLIDGVSRGDTTYACDYTYMAPCSNRSGSQSIDTAALADGARRVDVTAWDATDSNGGTAAATLNVDNHAPGAPSVTVDGGGVVQSARSWTLRWAAPAGQAAPITSARYEVCPSTGGACWTGSAAASANSGSISGDFGISAPGDYTVTIWLADAAGNVDSTQRSSAVHLRYDGGVPGPASIAPPQKRWLSGEDATTLSVSIAMAPGAAVPASGIAGYAVTVDGSDPGTTANVVADAGGNARYGPPPGGWPEGTVSVKARAVSGTGQAGPVSAPVVLHVDRTAPTTGVLGAGNGRDWQPGPLDVTLYASDALSGMGGADDGEPVEAGARVAYSLDGGALRQVAGGEAHVHVEGVGAHTLTLRAYDAAGNVSTDRTFAVAIGSPADGPAPAAAGFSARSTATGVFKAAPSFAGPCPPRAVLTPSRDTYVDEADPASSHGAASELVVRGESGHSARSLLAFPLPAANGCAVAGATLRLRPGAAPVDGLLAYRAGSAWDVATTWGTRPGVTGDAAPGRAAADGWVEFDVTDELRAIYRSGDDGFVVRGSGAQTFASSEAAAGDRPQLVVELR